MIQAHGIGTEHVRLSHKLVYSYSRNSMQLYAKIYMISLHHDTIGSFRHLHSHVGVANKLKQYMESSTHLVHTNTHTHTISESIKDCVHRVLALFR